jgi:hypothetical protein
MLPSASLFYSEGKGSGLLRNIGTGIYSGKPQNKPKSENSLPSESKNRYNLMLCFNIRYVAKNNIPLRNYFM